MFQRKTQTAEYWGSAFRFSEDDLAHLYGVLVDKGRPYSGDELGLELIGFRCRQEEAHVREELSKGTLYQPRDDYEVGQRLVFPVFDFAAGVVIEKRTGLNPEHGRFDVIKVQFEGQRKAREFVASLETPHKLNVDDGGEALLKQEGLLTPGELKESVAGDLEQRLATHLEAKADDSFVCSNGQWLLRDMLADVNVGHLNIAEALIEMAGQPVPPGRLLEEFDLPSEVSSEIQLFSLNHALEQDDRFDNIGVGGKRFWYLRRLQPEGALTIPEPLRYEPQSYDRSLLSAELLRFEWELGDEWSEEVVETPSAAPSVTFLLSYPHRHSGTLPLSFRTRGFFAAGETGRSMVTMVDGRWGQRFTAWVVYDGRYIVGLMPWFKEHKVPVGAYIVLQRGQEPGEIVVDIRPRRMRREWARLARVDEDQLVFEMRKMPIACEYDELMVVDALDAAAVEDLRQALRQEDMPLTELLDQVIPELLKLSPDGKVHAKTVYSAVNMVRRCPPGPIFAALSSSKLYQPEEGGFWSLA